MTRFHIRPYRSAEAAQVVRLINASAVDQHRRAVVDGAGAVRLQRFVPTGSERVVAVSGAGHLLGYAYLAEREPNLVYETGAFARPGEEQAAISAALLGWAEDRARQWAGASATGLRAVLQTHAFEEELDAVALAEEAGFIRVRDWLHMRRSLTSAAPSAADPPPGLDLRPMNLELDWDAVGPALEASFADHWGTVVLSDSLEGATDTDSVDEPASEIEDESFSNSPGFCLVWEGPLAVGGVLCNAKLVSGENAGRIGSLFVRPGYRRRGLGRALTLAALGAFQDAGLEWAVLDTDAASSTGGPGFYESLGFVSERFERLFEKEIRPGQEPRYLGPTP